MARCSVIVLGAHGIGVLPEVARYGKRFPARTCAASVMRAVGRPTPKPGRCGVAQSGVYAAGVNETVEGHDVLTGHWKMGGVGTDVPFPTNRASFPPEPSAVHEVRICGAVAIVAGIADNRHGMARKHDESSAPVRRHSVAWRA